MLCDKNLYQNISEAPIEEQITAAHTIENVTSSPENLTATDISASVATLVHLTQGAASNTQVTMLTTARAININAINNTLVKRELSASYR